MRRLALVWLAGCTPPDRPLVERPPPAGDAVSTFSLAVDGRGLPWLGWIDQGAAWVSSVSDDGVWRSPEALGGVGVAAGLDLATGPAGDALATWQERDGEVRRVRYARGTADAAWAMAADPISLGDKSYEPRAAIGPDGDAALLWNQWTGEHYGVALAVARASGETFAGPARVDDVLSLPVFFSNAPRVASGPDGALLVTWYQAQDDDLRVWVSERADRSEPMRRRDEPVSPTPGPVASDPLSNPKPALGPGRRAAVAWVQEDVSGAAEVYAAVREGVGWRTPSGTADALSDAHGTARHVELAYGAAGDLFVVWEEDDGVWCSAGEGAPSDPRWRLSASGARALDPSVAAGSGGTVAVAYRTLDDDGGTIELVTLRSGAVDPSVAPTVIARTTAPDAPRVSVGGPHDDVTVAFVERGPEAAQLRVFTHAAP